MTPATTPMMTIAKELDSLARPLSPLLKVSPTAAAAAAAMVPEKYRELYGALMGLREDATVDYVDWSRVQFVMRQLENDEAPVRIAVLDLDDDLNTALKLVHCMLSDPLDAKAEWETYLETSVDPSRGLLVRYGDELELSMPSSILPTITIPSRLLKTHNIEFLISPMGPQPLKMDAPHRNRPFDRFLVPNIPIHSSVGSHCTLAPFPVHKTIICGDGIDSVLAYGNIIGNENMSNKCSVSVQAAFQVRAQHEQARMEKGVTLIDTDRAIDALDKFRQSAKNASEFEKGWAASNVQALVDWLPMSTKSKEGLNTEVKRHIFSILEDAEMNIRDDEERALNYARACTVPDTVRKDLSVSVDFWAEKNHTELREELERGFATANWKNLTWWKLFWHVDDVEMYAEEIIKERWLKRAEAETLWIGGRLRQAGLLKEDINETYEEDATKACPAASPNQQSSPIESPSDATTAKHSHTSDGRGKGSMTLWPSRLSQARANLISSTVPPLHALAQNLVFFSISTTSLTSALSILTYLSSPAMTLYEAGVIATV
ncbi:hypothetical protein KEM54_000211, partial [Ascosphaera aggregata]